MKAPSEQQAVPEIVSVLADLMGNPPAAVDVQHVGATHPYDLLINAGGQRFIAEYKSHASSVAVAAAIDCLQRSAASDPGEGLPLIIVPFMGQVGRAKCDQSKISWVDLSGNAKVTAPGLRIWIEGRPNKFTARGRPANIFAPKSSRIARQLLHHPRQFQTQADLARQTGLGDGYVSKLVRRLRKEHYIVTNDEGAIRPRDPDLILDAWHDAYDFNHHRIIKGHVPTRTGEELLQRVAKELVHEQQEWGVTGLSAAWVYTNFATFRLTTFYLSSMPSRSLLERLEFSDQPKGANLWLVLPDDEGVFQGCQTRKNIQCVSPLQVYLDLKGHPERAEDAAAELRRKFLDWGHHGD